MNVLIRADASQAIGTGHVMRCVTLVRRLVADSQSVELVCAALPAALHGFLNESGVRFTELAAGDAANIMRDAQATLAVAQRMQPVDLLVVDNYRLDAAWERVLRPHVRRILVIDDLADRPHDCDFLLDVGLHEHSGSRYRERVPAHAVQFLGPTYALLRPEFDAPEAQRERDGRLARLLVFFGGTDPQRQVLKVVHALALLAPGSLPETRLILGWNHPDRDEVRRLAAALPGAEVLDVTQEMARHMAWADLAIGSCGGASWERCATGLPCLVSVTADNQLDDATLLHRMGAVDNLGAADAVHSQAWARAIQSLMGDPQRMRRMSTAARAVLHGRAQAVAELKKALCHGA